MASFNRVLLMGNLTRDPQLKYLPSQQAVAEFGIAINRKFKTAAGEDREEVTFVDVTAFGKTAEVINQHMRKGRAIFLEGRLKFDSWEDRNGGGKRSKLSVVMDNFQFLGDRPAGEGGGARDSRDARDGNQGERAPYPRDRSNLATPSTGAPSYGDAPGFKEDDIPF